jgi:hypothetical protein
VTLRAAFECQGCKQGLPLVSAGKLMDLGLDKIPSGWMQCLGRGDRWHSPSQEAIRRLGATPDEAPESPRTRKARVDREGPVRMAIRTVFDIRGVWCGDLEQGFRPGWCRHCAEYVSQSGGSCPSCGRKVRGGSRQTAGLPDLVCFYKGHAWWAEVKAPWKRFSGQSQSQKEWERASRVLGGMAYYLMDDPAQAVALLDHIDALDELPSGALPDRFVPGGADVH